MVCPYIVKEEVTVKQDTEADGDGGAQSLMMTEYKYLLCQQENCAVWYDGRCHYNGD